MKKLLVIFALGLGFLIKANAQGEGRPEMTPEKMAERAVAHMAERLGLDEAQKKKIYEMQLQHATDRKQRMDAIQKEMQASRDAHHAQISSVLTPEQKEKWEEMMQQRKERTSAWRDRGSEPRGEQPMNRKRGGHSGPHRGGPRSNS